MQKGSLYLVSAMAVSMFLGWLYGFSTKTENQNENYVDNRGNPEVSVLGSDIAQLKLELKKLRSIQDQEKIHGARDGVLGVIKDKDFTIQASNENNNSEKIKASVDKRYQRLAENYKNIENYDYYSAVHKAYDAEPYNESWAVIRSQKLRDAFASEKSLQDKSIKSIDCRSKHCRIDIFYQNKDDLEGVTGALTRLQLKDGERDLFIPSVDMNYSESEKIASVYLTDDPEASLY